MTYTLVENCLLRMLFPNIVKESSVLGKCDTKKSSGLGKALYKHTSYIKRFTSNTDAL